MKKTIETLEIYKESLELGTVIWGKVNQWEKFGRDTVGKQLVRSADSIAVNLSEGYGRYFYKERKIFCYYSRGSLYETRTWIKIANDRGYLSEKEAEKIQDRLEVLLKRLNTFIDHLKTQSQ